METLNKTKVKAMRFRPEVADQVQKLADMNGISFASMANLLLIQALKDPKLSTK